MLAYWSREKDYVSAATLESVPLSEERIREEGILPAFVVASAAKVEIPEEFVCGWAFQKVAAERIIIKYIPGETKDLSWEETKEDNRAKEIVVDISALELARRKTRDDDAELNANAQPWLESTWLSARAGLKAKDTQGFYCFYPGLRLGLDDFLDYKDSLHDCDVHKILSSNNQVSNPTTAAQAIAQVKDANLLSKSAWDPVNGPGWPGIYTSLDSEGISTAAREDIIQCKTWREAYELMSQVFVKRWRRALEKANLSTSAIQDMDTYLLTSEIHFNHFGGTLRALVPKFMTSTQFERCIRWLLSSTPSGRKLSRDHGVGFSAALIPEDQADMLLPFALESHQDHRVLMRTAILHLTFQSHASAAAALDFFDTRPKHSSNQQSWCLEIDGEPIVFSLGGLPIKSITELPEPRPVTGNQFCHLLRSKCGSFTFTSWWHADYCTPNTIFGADARVAQLMLIQNTFNKASATPGCFLDEASDSAFEDDIDDDTLSWLMSDTESHDDATELSLETSCQYDISSAHCNNNENARFNNEEGAIGPQLLHKEQIFWHLGNAHAAVGALVVVGAAAATTLFISSSL